MFELAGHQPSPATVLGQVEGHAHDDHGQRHEYGDGSGRSTDVRPMRSTPTRPFSPGWPRTLERPNALLPAGVDSSNQVDSPVGKLLDDAKTRGDPSDHRGFGRQPVTAATPSSCWWSAAARVRSVRRISPPRRNVPQRQRPPRADLRDCAVCRGRRRGVACRRSRPTSGGQYFEITKAMIDDSGGGPAGAGSGARGQHGGVSMRSCRRRPSTPRRRRRIRSGPTPSSQVTSPIVGTVNLRARSKIERQRRDRDAAGQRDRHLHNGTAEIPQRSNVLVTSAFVLPGFKGSCGRSASTSRCAMRETSRSGYRFSPGWLAALGQSSTSGRSSRNIFTVLPDGTMMPFTSTNAAAGTQHATSRVTTRRADGDVGAQPAARRRRRIDAGFLDPPSLDPPPDADYPEFREAEQGPPLADLRRRQRRHAARHRCADRRRSLGLHSVQPAAEAACAALRPVDRRRSRTSSTARRRFRTSRSAASGGRISSSDRDRAARSTTPSTSRSTASQRRRRRDSTTRRRLAVLLLDRRPHPVGVELPAQHQFRPHHHERLAPYGERRGQRARRTETDGRRDLVGPGHRSDPGRRRPVRDGRRLRLPEDASTQASANRRQPAAGTTFYVLDVATGVVLGTPRDVGADTFAETHGQLPRRRRLPRR